MPGLHTLVYVSSAVGALTEADLEAILAVSRDRNRQDDITGVLLYHDGNFMQCLEGESEKVHATYERICRDRRHTGTVVLIDAPITERSFSGWAMGYLQPTRSELLALSNAQWRDIDAEGPAGSGVSRGLIALRSFAKRGAR